MNVVDSKDIVLITIDALRADHVSCIGYHRKTTPTLDALARDGCLFTNCIANGSGTPSVLSSLLSSTYPLMHGGYERITSSRPLIQEALQSLGYYTAAIAPNAYLSRYYGYDRGFSTFIDFLGKEASFKKTKKRMRKKLVKKLKKSNTLFEIAQFLSNFQKMTVPYEEGDLINRKAGEIVEPLGEKKYFLWIHYMEPHGPHIPTQFIDQYRHISPAVVRKINKKLTLLQDVPPEELKILIDIYDSEVQLVDSYVGSFIKELTEITQRAPVFIITADHGEEFLDHGDLNHHPKLYEELIHVPLIVHGLGASTPVNQVVQHLDIAPTILDIAGGTSKSFYGTSLLPVVCGDLSLKNRHIISEVSNPSNILRMDPLHRKTSVRTEKYKFIYYEGSGKCELFDLVEDPGEKVNLAKKKKEKTEYFIDKIGEHKRIEAEAETKNRILRIEHPEKYEPSNLINTIDNTRRCYNRTSDEILHTGSIKNL